MQIDVQTNEQLINVLHSAENIAIVPAKGAGTDAFCAGVALHLMLRSLDKSSKILYPESVPESCQELIAPSDLITAFSQRQLTVTIDYAGEHDAKAWYEPEGETLKVKLAPVSKGFDPSLKVRAKLDSGFDFDTAIVLGANELEDLGFVYEEIRTDLAKSTIINLSNSSKNNRFGSINIIDPMSDSLSQLIIKKAPLWELTITTQAAQALLLGITQK
jgi:nanoRNase/pAp phosphatase (c-di-AMP/oligoRNAs hydrolase)